MLKKPAHGFPAIKLENAEFNRRKNSIIIDFNPAG